MVKDLVLKFLKRLLQVFFVAVIIFPAISLIRTGTFTNIDFLDAFVVIITLSLTQTLFEHYRIYERYGKRRPKK